MYELIIKPEIGKILARLAKKESAQVEIILRKVDEILQNPRRYKNLRAPLNSWKRVHIDSHFVLLFSVDENAHTVTLEDYNHHDKIYKPR